jgi:selenide,water dikinase
MHPANATAAARLERAAPVDEELLQIVFDPQTSGGLLLGVAADRAPGLLDALRRGGYPQANIIGEVLAAGLTPPGRVAIT